MTLQPKFRDPTSCPPSLDVIDPDGLHVQLHTRELVSRDDI
jgi:hypothetical protein